MALEYAPRHKQDFCALDLWADQKGRSTLAFYNLPNRSTRVPKLVDLLFGSSGGLGLVRAFQPEGRGPKKAKHVKHIVIHSTILGKKDLPFRGMMEYDEASKLVKAYERQGGSSFIAGDRAVQLSWCSAHMYLYVNIYVCIMHVHIRIPSYHIYTYTNAYTHTYTQTYT